MSWHHQNRRLYAIGPQYSYNEINGILQKYQRKYGRKWKRADYMTYWVKVKDGIEIRMGWHCMTPFHRKGERLMLMFPDGRINVSTNLSYPYERYRFNRYFPHRDKWSMWWWHDGLILSRDGKPIEEGIVISPRYWQDKNNHIRSRYIHFDKHGELIDDIGHSRFKEYKKMKIREANQRAKPRKRGWYWTRRAKNLYRNQKKCTSNNTSLIWEERRCDATQWERQGPQSYPCGCVTYRKTYKRGFSKTVKQILEEENATVRSAWIQIYGIQKFFMDAGSRVISHRENYQLLRLQTGGDEDQDEVNITALKMTCPTTGTVYINAVPQGINTVPTALNWMYNVPDYLNTVGKQT